MNWWLDHPRMVINMDEVKLRTIAQLQDFLNATQEIRFTGAPGNTGLDHAAPSTWTSKFIKMSNMFDIFNRIVAQ